MVAQYVDWAIYTKFIYMYLCVNILWFKYHSVWVKLVECYIWEMLMEHHAWVMTVEWHAWVMLVDYQCTVQVSQVVVRKLAEQPMTCPSSTTLLVP